MNDKAKRKWLIAFSCCFINCMLYGVSRLSGMLLIPLVETYGVSRASAALPFSISSCIRNLIGPFAGQLSQYFGIREVAAFGCILAWFGSSMCYYADSMLVTTIFWGGIFGTGLGISTTLMPLAINQNFSTFQSTASGISYSGAFIGSFIFPPLLTYAICEYSLPGSFLIISGTMLNSLVAVMFLRSPAKAKSKNVPKNTGCIENDKSISTSSKSDSQDMKLSLKNIDNRFGDLKFKSSNHSPLHFLVSKHQVPECSKPILLKFSKSQEANLTINGNLPHNLHKFSLDNGFRNKDAEGDDISSSYNVLQRINGKLEVEPIYILNLDETLKQNENADKISVNQNTFYQKCGQYMQLIKRFLSLNIGSYSLTERKQNSIPTIHGQYLDNINSQSFKLSTHPQKHSKYFNNSAESNIIAKNINGCHDIVEELQNSTTLALERYHERFAMDELGVTNKNKIDINEKLCKDVKLEILNPRDLSRSSNHDYAEPLSHPKVLAVDSFPTYHNSSKHTSSFNIQDSNCQVQEKFEGCFLEWLKMFSDPVFMSISGTMSLFSFVTICILTIIEDYAKDCGVSQSNVHFVLMTMSAADLLGTLTLGWITDKGYITRSRFTAACFFGIAVTVACIPFTHSFCQILAVVTMYGILESGVLIMFPLLTAEYINPRRHTIALASTHILSSPAMLLVPLAIGYFRDNLGHYDGLFYLLSLASAVCCVAWLFVPHLLFKHHQSNKISIHQQINK